MARKRSSLPSPRKESEGRGALAPNESLHRLNVFGHDDEGVRGHARRRPLSDLLLSGTPPSSSSSSAADPSHPPPPSQRLLFHDDRIQCKIFDCRRVLCRSSRSPFSRQAGGEMLRQSCSPFSPPSLSCSRLDCRIRNGWPSCCCSMYLEQLLPTRTCCGLFLQPAASKRDASRVFLLRRPWKKCYV